MAEGNRKMPEKKSKGVSSSLLRESPPKAVIDTSPIHMDQNKESLKVKLLLRRPFDQLVEQGIMPPHTTPGAYHGQRRQLERAKTGDMLKAKIQQRPPRQELERRHILEADPAHVDPSLAEKQRMLKKARLADQLNDQLSHRPGPLELIQKNILHTEAPIEQAVKTGRIPYKATSEGQHNRPQHPNSYVTPEEDSLSSEGDIISPGTSDVLETAAKSAGIVVSLIQPSDKTTIVSTSASIFKENRDLIYAEMCKSVTNPLQISTASPASLISSTSTLSPLSSVASPVPTLLSQPATPVPAPPPPPPINLVSRSISFPAKSDAPGKDKNRKKNKSKSVPKTRTIKFHEYKGPPSAQKSSNLINSGESSYDLLLKQQTLLLQFQLQLQHKYPQIILPASQKINDSNISQPSSAPSTSSESSISNRISGRLEDMKVSDLKGELKRRNLPVSGSKQNLIDRLKSFSAETGNHISNSFQNNLLTDQSYSSKPCQNNDSSNETFEDDLSEKMDIGNPMSPDPQEIQEKLQQIQQQVQENTLKTKEDIVREQQRQIEELQRELTLSQLKLQAATRQEPKTQLIALQKHLQAKQQQQQQNIAEQMRQLQALQAKQSKVSQVQQRLQQQQHVAFQNQKNHTNSLILNGTDASLVFNQLLQEKAKINSHNRTNSLPNVLNITPIIPASDIKTENILESGKDLKPPPLYEEATKQNNKKHIKSQIVDDVLEILIKNGELPPSAANDPATPASAIKNEPIFSSPRQNKNDNQLNGNVESSSPALGMHPCEILESLELENMDFSNLMEFSGCQPQNENNNVQSESDIVPMDTDDWLESLLPRENTYNSNNSLPLDLTNTQDLAGYDPLLGIAHDPFDPFSLEEFRTPADLTASLSWDKIDYTA